MRRGHYYFRVQSFDATMNKRFTWGFWAGVIGVTVLMAAGGTAGGMAMSSAAKADTAAKNAANDAAGAKPPTAGPETGALPGAPSLDAQASQRRLARMSKYFTSPSGVLDTTTGSAGVF